jgi:hypothetical protein
MRTIWKYPIRLADGAQSFDLPIGAKVLRFAPQRRELQMWVELNPDLRLVPRSFAVFGTGHEIPRQAEHVGSCEDGSFIWHLYELPPA